MNDHEYITGAGVLLPLSTGITIGVRFLTPIILQSLSTKSETLFPAPIEADYKIEITEVSGVPLLPGTTSQSEAKENPAYLQAFAECTIKRADFLLDAIMRIAVHPIDDVHRDAILATYADALNEARKLDVLVESEGDSEFYLVMRHFVPLNQDDFNAIVAAAQRKGVLTEAEIADGRAYFRTKGQRDTRQRLATVKSASNPNGKTQHIKEQLPT